MRVFFSGERPRRGNMSNAVKQAKALGAGARPTLLNNILASLEEDLRPYYLGRAWLSSALAIAGFSTSYEALAESGAVHN